MVEELAWIYADGLLGLDGRPLLAAGEPRSLDANLRYRYRLRRAEFHDGEPLRADHIEAAWRTLAATPRGNQDPYDAVAEVVAANRTTFDVVLHRRVGAFQHRFFAAPCPGGVPIVRERDGRAYRDRAFSRALAS